MNAREKNISRLVMKRQFYTEQIRILFEIEEECRIKRIDLTKQTELAISSSGNKYFRSPIANREILKEVSTEIWKVEKERHRLTRNIQEINKRIESWQKFRTLEEVYADYESVERINAHLKKIFESVSSRHRSPASIWW